jgi:peptide/nickel transport system permease protein
MTDQGTLAPLPAEVAPAIEMPRRGRFWSVFAQNRMAMAGLVILGAIVAASLLGPLLSPYQAEVLDVANRYQTPSLEHPMGTDDLGRDVLTRVLAGGRLSLAVGALATVVALAIGITVGAVAGFRPGWVDNVLMRLVDMALSLPDLFLLILATALIGPSVVSIVIIISLVRWMNVARLVRASFLSLREREFVEAARATGAGPLRIVLQHLLPNSLSPVIVAGTLGVASAIIAESTLSFLGLGLQPPASSWGSMLRSAQSQIFTSPWLAVFPGAMIFLTVISINFIGDGLRDALDPATLRVHRGARRLLDEIPARRPSAGPASQA